MPVGPGKYNTLGTLIMEATQADAIAVIVFNGKLGSGFEVQALEGFDQNAMADALEKMVYHIRSENPIRETRPKREEKPQ